MTNNMFEPTPGAFKPSGFFDNKESIKEDVQEEVEEEIVQEE